MFATDDRFRLQSANTSPTKSRTMRIISIQIQQISDPALDIELVLSELSSHGIKTKVQEGTDDVHYTNVNFESNNYRDFWLNIDHRLMVIQGFANNTIVVCEGNSGWDYYLLLHHFDSTEKLDIIRNN